MKKNKWFGIMLILCLMIVLSGVSYAEESPEHITSIDSLENIDEDI